MKTYHSDKIVTTNGQGNFSKKPTLITKEIKFRIFQYGDFTETVTLNPGDIVWVSSWGDCETFQRLAVSTAEARRCRRQYRKFFGSQEPKNFQWNAIFYSPTTSNRFHYCPYNRQIQPW